MSESPAKTFVRVRSHRAAGRLKAALGYEKLDWHFNMHEGNRFVLIPVSRLPVATAIPGITKARTKHELLRCWPR